jgi:hypothetical protein
MKAISKNDKISQLRNILKKLQSNDSDPTVRKFCSIVYNEQLFYEISKNIFDERPLVEEEHLLFLVFVSLQYLTNFSYDNVYKITAQKVRTDLETHKTKIHRLCVNRNVSTNIPERYVGLQIISSMLYSKYQQPLTIIDIGCSLGLGLMALNTTFFEKHITIDTELLRYVRSKPVFRKVVGLDIQELDLDWGLASYLPEAKKKRKSVKHICDYLNKNGSKFEMIQGNALEIKKIQELSPSIADIVWISNTCYQVEGDVEDVIKGIGWLLKDGGLWLYAYYRHDIDEKITPKTNPYIVSVYRKDKDWAKKINKGLQEFKQHGLDVLEAPNELVDNIKRGRVYEKFNF